MRTGSSLIPRLGAAHRHGNHESTGLRQFLLVTVSYRWVQQFPVLEQSNKIRKKKNWDGVPKGLKFWTPKYKAIMFKLPFFCR